MSGGHLMLSKHFSLAELTKTSTILPNNTTSTVAIDNLRRVCSNMLEEARNAFGRPIIVNSGYRSYTVNKAVGGSDRSQHLRGEAVDFHVQGHSVYEVALWVSENLDYDQLILEDFVPGAKSSGWVHCSFSKVNRAQNLTKFRGSKKYYGGIMLKPE